MDEFFKFGQNLRGLLRGLLAVEPEPAETPRRPAGAARVPGFEEKFFLDEVNRFVGSGGEILLKGEGNRGGSPTQMEVGDRLIGIGITHLIESLSRPPGPDAFRPANAFDGEAKAAARAFEVKTKQQLADGFRFTFAPLPPKVYSETLETVSEGAVQVPADTIPEGTMILSFLLPGPTYTLRRLRGSPGENWAGATRGSRHWCVGVGSPDDFWAAHFPSDDVGLLAHLPSSTRVGSIMFGLSLLSGATDGLEFAPVQTIGPTGVPTSHQFCLSGSAAGTGGLDTPFPIGLRTEILFHPVRGQRRADAT